MSKNAKSDHEAILGGRGEIYRMARSGDVFQCRVWLPKERRYLRRSLRTTSPNEARILGEELVLKTLQDLSIGKKLFGITLHQLCDLYLEYRKQEVGLGDGITEGRFRTLTSQIRAVKNLMSDSVKVGDLNENSFFDWGKMRREAQPTLQAQTIRNEQSTLGSMFDFAYRNKFTHTPKLSFQPMQIKRDAIGRRDIFSLDEYDSLIRFLRRYTSEKTAQDEGLDEKERLERLKVRDYIFILSNTLMRTGELRKMRWKDVLGYKETKDEKGRPVVLVRLHIRAETSKVRNERRIVVRGGEYFRRVLTYSKTIEPEDLLFTNSKNGNGIPDVVLYKHWREIMKSIDIPNYKERKLSYYSLRHFGITMRMNAKVPIADVAVIAGTSYQQIESHYRHPDEEMMVRGALANFSRTDEGGFTDI